ncbi:MAG: YdcH family protein [Sphingomonadales bacterium]
MTQSSHVAALTKKHAVLDEKILTESQRPWPNYEQLTSWKKEKLRLKQQIVSLSTH